MRLVQVALICAFSGSAFAQEFTIVSDLEVIRDIQVLSKEAKTNPKFEMVDLRKFIPGIQVDLRYATHQNFMGEVLYRTDHVLLRREAAERLRKVQKDLKQVEAGLVIYDAYRPYSVTVKMWNAKERLGIGTGFLAPSWIGSKHNRGVAVDVGLVDLKTGKRLEMSSEFDEFSEKAYLSYEPVSDEVRRNRKLLYETMVKHGFKGYEKEWWDYSLESWRSYSLLDIPAESFR